MVISAIEKDEIGKGDREYESCSFKRVVREGSLRQWYKKKEMKEMRVVAMWVSGENASMRGQQV